MNGHNLYSVANGDYYTFVLVIAENEEEALVLAKESYIKEGRSHDALTIDLEIENIQGSIASKVLEA